MQNYVFLILLTIWMLKYSDKWLWKKGSSCTVYIVYLVYILSKLILKIVDFTFLMIWSVLKILIRAY